MQSSSVTQPSANSVLSRMKSRQKLQNRLRPFAPTVIPAELTETVRELCESRLKELAYTPLKKEERADQTALIYRETIAAAIEHFKAVISSEEARSRSVKSTLSQPAYHRRTDSCGGKKGYAPYDS